MDGKLFLIGQLITILLTAGAISSLYYGISHALRRLHLPRQRQELTLKFTTAGMLFWLAILALLAAMGFFFEPGTTQERVLWAFALPSLLAPLLLFSRFFNLLLRAIPESWFFYIQGLRIFTELLLWLGAKGGYVPVQMTFEWLNYDIVVGITGIMAGYVFFGGRRHLRLEGVIWNTFGLVSLLNLMLISIISLPGRLNVFATVPDSIFLTLVPFIWLPGFLFPLALAMHLFSLRQLLSLRRGKSRLRRRFFLHRQGQKK